MEHTHDHTHESHNHTHETHHSAHKSSLKLTTPIAIIAGAILITLGIIAHGFVYKGGGDATIALAPFTGTSIPDEKYKEGTGKVYVVEYADTECPFCIQFEPTMKQLRQEYKDKITYIYRFFPLVQIHPHALPEAINIACAAKLSGSSDTYFKYITALFDKKDMNNRFLQPGVATDLAKTFGIDEKAFNDCSASKEMSDTVTASIQDGVAAGVNATPTTFILVKSGDGTYKIIKTIEGATNYNYLKAAVDQAIYVSKQ